MTHQESDKTASTHEYLLTREYASEKCRHGAHSQNVKDVEFFVARNEGIGVPHLLFFLPRIPHKDR